jgi:hypothetical protein
MMAALTRDSNIQQQLKQVLPVVVAAIICEYTSAALLSRNTCCCVLACCMFCLDHVLGTTRLLMNGQCVLEVNLLC